MTMRSRRAEKGVRRKFRWDRFLIIFSITLIGFAALTGVGVYACLNVFDFAARERPPPTGRRPRR